jgi:small subunit ribosomal protein S18e
VSGEKTNFQYILRLLNTNVDGKQKIMYALTQIKGVGRRYSNLVCKKADVDLSKRYVQSTFDFLQHLQIAGVVVETAGRLNASISL